MAQYEVEGQFAANLTVKAREANDDLPSRFSDLRNARIEVHGFAGRNKVEGSDEGALLGDAHLKKYVAIANRIERWEGGGMLKHQDDDERERPMLIHFRCWENRMAEAEKAELKIVAIPGIRRD